MPRVRNYGEPILDPNPKTPPTVAELVEAVNFLEAELNRLHAKYQELERNQRHKKG